MHVSCLHTRQYALIYHLQVHTSSSPLPLPPPTVHLLRPTAHWFDATRRDISPLPYVSKKSYKLHGYPTH